MGLNYDQFYNWYYPNDDRDKAISNYIISSIKSRTEKQSKKQEEIDNLTYEKGLIVDDIVKLIKEDLANCSYNIFRYINIGNTMWKAWTYFCHKKNKTLKDLKPNEDEKKEDYKMAFNFIDSQIKRTLIPEKYKDAKLIDFLDCSFSTSYELTYKVDDVEFCIEIPMFHNTTTTNYMIMLSGYCLRQYIGCEITLEFCSINWEEFRDKLEKWLDEKLHKETK